MTKFIKRIGTEAMRFQFDVNIKAVNISLPKNVELFAVLKRGPRRSETNQKVTVGPNNKVAKFDETLSVLATLYKNTKKHTYNEKSATISVNCIINGKTKNVGNIKFNLSDFAEAPDGKPASLHLQKCPDKNATVDVVVKSTWIKGMEAGDDMISEMPELSQEEESLDDFESSRKGTIIETEPIHEEDSPQRGIEKKKVTSPMNIFVKDPENKVTKDIPIIPRAKIKGMSSFHSRDSTPSQKNTPTQRHTVTIDESKQESNLYAPTLKEKPKSEEMFLTYHQQQLQQQQQQQQMQAQLQQQYLEEKKKDAELSLDPAPSKSWESSGDRQKLTAEILDLKEKLINLERDNRLVKDENVQLTLEYQRKLKDTLNDRENINNKKDEQERRIFDLESQRDKLEAERAKIEAAYKKSKKNYDELKEVVAEKEIELDEHKKGRDNSETQLQQVESERKKIKETLERYELQNNELKNKLMQTDNSNTKLTMDNDELHTNINMLRNQLQDSRAQIEKSNSSIKSNGFNEYKAQTEILVSDLRKQVEDLSKKNKDLMLKNDDLQIEQQERQMRYEKRESELKNEVSTIRAQNMRNEDLAKDYEEKLTSMNKDKKSAEVAYEKKIEELGTSLNSTRAEINHQENKLKEKDDRLRSLEQKLRFLEEENQEKSSTNEGEIGLLREKLLKETDELRAEIRAKNKEITELKHDKEEAEEEVVKLKRKTVNDDDLMNGNVNLISQIRLLQNQLVEKETEAESRINELIDENKKLRKAGNNAEGDNKKKSAVNEKEFAKISVQNQFLKEQVSEYELKIQDYEREAAMRKNTDDQASHNEIKGLRDLVNHLKEDNTEQRDKVKDLENRCSLLENNLVDAKMAWANIELEKENMTYKVREKNEQLKIFSSKVTKLELDLVKAKQDLGEAMNAVYEYEQNEHKQITDSMEKNLTFKEKPKKGFMGIF